MAAPKKPAAKSGNAIVQRAQVNLPANVQEAMNADIAASQQRMSAPVGNRISVTQDKKFRNAAGEKYDTIRGVIVDFVAKKAWYEGDYDKDDVDVRFRAVFWRGYALGLLTVFALLGMMYV